MGLIDTLLTPRLILEPLAMRHAESYERNFVDYEVIRHLSAAVPWPYPEGGVADYISTVIEPRQGEGHWHWALALRDAPEEDLRQKNYTNLFQFLALQKEKNLKNQRWKLFFFELEKEDENLQDFQK